MDTKDDRVTRQILMPKDLPGGEDVDPPKDLPGGKEVAAAVIIVHVR